MFVFEAWVVGSPPTSTQESVFEAFKYRRPALVKWRLGCLLRTPYSLSRVNLSLYANVFYAFAEYL